MLDFDKIKNPGDVPLDSSLINFVQAQLSAAQQAEEPELDENGEPLPMAEGGPPEGAEGEKEGEDEPDYDNMSEDELQEELDRLSGMDETNSHDMSEYQKSDKIPKFMKSFFKELDIRK